MLGCVCCLCSAWPRGRVLCCSLFFLSKLVIACACIPAVSKLSRPSTHRALLADRDKLFVNFHVRARTSEEVCAPGARRALQRIVVIHWHGLLSCGCRFGSCSSGITQAHADLKQFNNVFHNSVATNMRYQRNGVIRNKFKSKIRNHGVRIITALAVMASAHVASVVEWQASCAVCSKRDGNQRMQTRCQVEHREMVRVVLGKGGGGGQRGSSRAEAFQP